MIDVGCKTCVYSGVGPCGKSESSYKCLFKGECAYIKTFPSTLKKRSEAFAYSLWTPTSEVRSEMRKLRELNQTKYTALGKEIGKIVDEKQAAYGDSFGKSGDVLRIMFPDGVKPEQYDDILSVARILDKLFRIATKKDAFGESPYGDIIGYGLLGKARDDEGKQ